MKKKTLCRRFFCAALILFTASIPTARTYAKTTEERLNEAQEEQRETQEQLEDTKDNLSSLEGQRNGLQEELSILNDQLNEVRANLEQIEENLDAKEGEIERTQAALAEARETELLQYESMKERIRFMYENGETTYLEMLFSANGFADFLNKSEYIGQIEQYDRRKLEEYQETCLLIAQQEELLGQELTELQELREEARLEQERVDGLVTETSERIAGYSDQISDTEAQMRAYEAELARQNDNIEALQAQLAEERRLAALAAQSAWRDISEVQFEEGDRYLLANLIYCEAGGEPYEGKVAVGAVVINRMLSKVFPDTMVGVIYAPRQFSPVASGRLALALSQNRATESCYRAADEAMNGRTNVEDCLFFRTPIDSITPRYRISGHIFY
ncbi:MAG: cell wall hydrolase [bacterium]|nr:cell wall hydrolase [bacterium]